MCDWLSWGVLSPKQQKELGLKSRIGLQLRRAMASGQASTTSVARS